MSCVRQFIHKERKKSVVCEWDLAKGGWTCATPPGEAGYSRSPSIEAIRAQLKELGYHELSPTSGSRWGAP